MPPKRSRDGGAGHHSKRPFVDELPAILEERKLSIRALALSAGVSPSHLTRVLRQRDYKTPSAELCRRIAQALDLPDDYWPEYRERVVTDRVRNDPELREELYRRFARNSLE